MKGKQLLLLFLALLLPVCIFVMLKMFGKNQFDVSPLFTDTLPSQDETCNTKVKLPYLIPDSVFIDLPIGNDSLLCILFDDSSSESNTHLQRVVEHFQSDPLVVTSTNGLTNPSWRKCVFFLQEPFDVVLVDRRGAIRGQYDSKDRDEIDRLITEATIILKKY